MAVEVGRAKKIIPVLKGMPAMENDFKRKNPIVGSINSFNMDEIKETFELFFSPASVKEPPMEISARGMVTAVIRANVLSIKAGKDNWDLEKKVLLHTPGLRDWKSMPLINTSGFVQILPFFRSARSMLKQPAH